MGKLYCEQYYDIAFTLHVSVSQKLKVEKLQTSCLIIRIMVFYKTHFKLQHVQRIDQIPVF